MSRAGFWRIRTVDVTGSTNADMATAARNGEPEGAVLVAGQQTAGRGRLGRQWESPPGTSFSCSLLLRPTDVPVARWTWLPMLTGVAVARAVRSIGVVLAVLKWPNDILVNGAKLGGILVERIDSPRGAAAVVGIGLNVGQQGGEVPPGATSLALEGSSATRDEVLAALLDQVGVEYARWRGAGGDPTAGLRASYLELCDTIGRDVTLELPGAAPVRGRAVDVDDDGRLVLAVDGEFVVASSGDVVHVRTVSS